jgi:hypothetical protein
MIRERLNLIENRKVKQVHAQQIIRVNGVPFLVQVAERLTRESLASSLPISAMLIGGDDQLDEWVLFVTLKQSSILYKPLNQSRIVLKRGNTAKSPQSTFCEITQNHSLDH